MVLVVVVGLVFSSGCAASRSAEPQTGLVPLTDDVAAAYDAFWTAWVKANETSDPGERSLDQHAMDPLLQTIRANLASAREANTSARGALRHNVQGMDVDRDTRRVVDCIELGDWLMYELDSGQAVSGQLTAQRSQLTTLVLRRHGDGWKASNMYVGSECA